MAKTKNQNLPPILPTIPEKDSRKCWYGCVLLMEEHLVWRTTIENILYREYVNGLHFETLGDKEKSKKGNSYRLYSGRIEQKDRLLCLVINIQGQKVLVILAMIEHNYDRALIIDPACLKNFVDKWLPQWEHCYLNQHDPAFEKPASDREFMVFNRHSRPAILKTDPEKWLKPERSDYLFFLTSKYLSHEQAEALALQGPAIIYAAAGTGKTDMVALAMHQQYLEDHPEEKKPGLFLVNTPLMKTWVTQACKNRGINLNRICIMTNEDFHYAYFSKKLNIPEAEIREKMQFIEKSAIENWYRGEEGPLKKYKLLQKTGKGIAEFDVMKEDIDRIIDALKFMKGLSKEEFLNLEGGRQSPWQDRECRKQLYDILESLQNWCLRQGYLYLPLIETEFEEAWFSMATIDEAQNQTLQAHQNYFYSTEKANIFYFLDSNQIIHANFNIQKNLKGWLEKMIKTEPAVKPLSICFRSSEKVVESINVALGVKNLVCGRSSKDEIPGMQASGKAMKGMDSCIFEPGETALKKLASIFRNAENGVLVPHENLKTEAKRIFATERVYTILEAIGMEFDILVEYNFYSCSEHQASFIEMNKLLKAIYEEAEARGETIHLDHAIHRPKSGKQVEASMRIFAALRYLADSRAKNRIIRVESRKPSRMDYVLDAHRILKLNTKATCWKAIDRWTEESMEDTLQSTDAEWEKKVLDLLDMGKKHWDNALKLYLAEKLGKDVGEFLDFCISHGRNMKDYFGKEEAKPALQTNHPQTITEKSPKKLHTTKDKNKPREENIPLPKNAEKPQKALLSLPVSEEEFCAENMIQWVKSKKLFNPADPENSRLAQCLQDERKYELLHQVLFEDNYIQYLDAREFCRFFLGLKSDFSVELSFDDYYDLHFNFLTRHPKAPQMLFENITPHAQPTVKLKKTRKNKVKNAHTATVMEASPDLNYLAWLNFYDWEILALACREKGHLWLPYLKKDFFDRYLMLLCSTHYGHLLLNEIVQFNEETLYQIMEGLSVELFARCYADLVNSAEGLEFFYWAVRCKSKLLYEVVFPAINSGIPLPDKSCSLRDVMNITWAGKTILAMLIPLENRLQFPGFYIRPGFSYSESCAYIQDLINFLQDDAYRKNLLFAWDFFIFDGYSRVFDFLLSRAMGRKILLEIFRENPEIIQRLEPCHLRKHSPSLREDFHASMMERSDLTSSLRPRILNRNPKHDDFYPENLVYSEIWPELVILFCEHNKALKKDIETHYLAVISADRESIGLPLMKSAEAGKTLQTTGNFSEKRSPGKTVNLSAAQFHCILDLLQYYDRENLLKVLRCKQQLLDTLLFSKFNLNNKTTLLLSEIIMDPLKYNIFSEAIIPFINKLNAVSLAQFFLSSSLAIPCIQNFLALVLKNYANNDNQQYLLLSVSFTPLRNFLFAEIVNNSENHPMLKAILEDLITDLDPHTIHYLLLNHYPAFNTPGMQDFLSLVLKKSRQRDIFLFQPNKQIDGPVYSAHSFIVEDPKRSPRYFKALVAEGLMTPDLLFRSNYRNSGKGSLFGSLIQSEEGCSSLDDFFVLEFTKDSRVAYETAFQKIWMEATEDNAVQIRNLCSSPEGQGILASFILSMHKRQISLKFVNSLLYEAGINYKDEMISAFEALHRSTKGLHIVYILLNHSAIPENGYLVKEIADTGYAPLHAWNYTRNGMEIKQMVLAKKEGYTLKLDVELTDGFREKLALALDWLEFYGPTEVTMLGNFCKLPELKSTFGNFQSIWKFLLSRLESRAELYWFLSRKPEYCKEFNLSVLITNADNPALTAIFHPELFETAMGKKILTLIKAQNKGLEIELLQWIKTYVCKILEQKQDPIQIFQLGNYLNNLTVFGGERLVRVLMTTLLESEKKALIHQKFNPGEETESALQSRFSFLNTASKTITLCDWFLSLDLVKDIPEEACPDNPKKSATL